MNLVYPAQTWGVSLIHSQCLICDEETFICFYSEKPCNIKVGYTNLCLLVCPQTSAHVEVEIVVCETNFTNDGQRE